LVDLVVLAEAQVLLVVSAELLAPVLVPPELLDSMARMPMAAMAAMAAMRQLTVHLMQLVVPEVQAEVLPTA